ncbi:uncharacterized protein LOC133203671 [Saccostrea echinata]|uniref:uncharacterized protein LOC133203671 n=1 Tax=Saccostrea echinata TaxID=191078 RepID=UPI002A8276A8|nr:uncharacterized protein LOC133203671 [Saccostrea echinata]
MNRQNIPPLHPGVLAMGSPLSGPQSCLIQAIGISNQELESLLAKPAKELPVQVFHELGNKLQPMSYGVRTGDWVHVAELLGFSQQHIENFEVKSNIQRESAGFLMLMEWRGHEDCSTLFILRDTLWSCGRYDCVTWLDQKIEETMFMHLYLRIIDDWNPSSPMRLLKVRTKCDSTIQESLQNLLGGDSDDSEYELVDTPLLSKAKGFKGKQITLRKKASRRPDLLPCNITAGETSSSDNSIENSIILTQMKQVKYLPSVYSNTSPCCLREEDQEEVLPKSCGDTIKKTIYITEDCVYCGKMRTVSQRLVSEASSAIKTGVHCLSCNCSASPLPTTQPLLSQSSVPGVLYQHFSRLGQDISPSSEVSSNQYPVMTLNTENRLSECSLVEDSERTSVKQLHRDTASENFPNYKPKANSYIMLPSGTSVGDGLQGFSRDQSSLISASQTKRQRSVSEPPDILVAELKDKFDLSMPSSSAEIQKLPKKRKIEISYQEICEIMRNFPGWDPDETENMVEQSMSHYCKEDGHYVIWYMRETHRLVVTVSHMRKLVHYAVFSERHSNGQDWHYFFPEHKFPDIRSLLRHHMENGLDPQSSQRGQGRRDFDKQQNMRNSRREVILSHVTLKYPRRPQPIKSNDKV